MARAAKVLHRPVEVREALPVPRGAEDTERGQHRAGDVLKRLGTEVLKLKQGVLVGGDDPDQKPPFQVDGFLFVTDVDLYTARTDGVMAALISKLDCALVSVRRQREAFYKRKANPTKQRSRLVKELLRMAGRLRGLRGGDGSKGRPSRGDQTMAIEAGLPSHRKRCSPGSRAKIGARTSSSSMSSRPASRCLLGARIHSRQPPRGTLPHGWSRDRNAAP